MRKEKNRLKRSPTYVFSKNWIKFWPIILITIVAFAFHLKLFFPEPALYVTPDFARSDALHSNIPAKLELAKSLKSFELPIWTNKIGQGFPLLAEGIVGAFYLPNLLIFGLLPLNLTIPVMYVTTSLISALGMYALLSKLKFSAFPSITGALSFSFCASIMLHLQHFNFIQAASLLPLILYLSLDLIEKTNLKTSLLLAIVYSQLLFTGFVQIYAYSVIIFSILTILFAYLTKNKNTKKILFVYLLITFASLILSAAQILPSFELNSKSGRKGGLDPSYILNSFPMPPKNLITYINPFILGKAEDGTYNTFNWSKKGIYWESTSYIGAIAIFLALTSIIFLPKAPDKKLYISILVLVGLTILLSLGKSSPLHLVFSFPPLNFFRVPSRFILFTQFFLAILAAFGAKKIIDIIPNKFKSPLGILLVTVVVVDIFIVWNSYNPIGSFAKWTAPPETAEKILRTNPQARILTLGSGEVWNKTFVSSGWKNKADDYYFYRNALGQNFNLLFGINQSQMFETLPTRRYKLVNAYLASYLTYKDNEITVDEKAKQLLDSNNVEFIVSTKQINNTNYTNIFETKKDDIVYKIYQSDKGGALGKMYYDYKTVNVTTDYTNVFNEINFDQTIVLEKELTEKQFENSTNKVKTQKITDTNVVFEVETQKPGIFVASISYFPGWKATINKQETEIYPANANSQAIVVPRGKHVVEFTYKPKSLYIGLFVTLATYTLALFAIFKLSTKAAGKQA